MKTYHGRDAAWWLSQATMAYVDGRVQPSVLMCTEEGTRYYALTSVGDKLSIGNFATIDSGVVDEIE